MKNKQIHIRMDTPLWETILKAARKRRMNLTAWILQAIYAHLLSSGFSIPDGE